jgi:S-adenosyl-L-methionine hydrolase (adenosine-forming)
MSDPRPITFLSDYGHEDEFAGVCRAVIARIAPGARLIDLTHGVPRHDIRRGAVALADALPYAPPGVHLAVVDPGVGSGRRAVAGRVDDRDRILVGPDNGLLWPAMEGLGGVVEAVDLSSSSLALDPVSATFHGRDLFAPVAARLALGAALAEVGETIDPDSLERLALPPARLADGALVAEVLYLDRFGNVTLGVRPGEPEAAGIEPGRQLSVRAGGSAREAAYVGAFAEVAEGGLLVYEDSSPRLAIAINRGSAAEALGVEPGDEVTLTPK